MPLIIAKIMRAIILVLCLTLVVCAFIGPRIHLLAFSALFWYMGRVIDKEIKAEEELEDNH